MVDSDPTDITDRVDALRDRLLHDVVEGSISDEKHAELASIVSEYQNTLRPHADELPAAADINPIDDGDPADVSVLLVALDALDEVAYSLGFHQQQTADA